jgi:hypothetical protein
VRLECRLVAPADRRQVGELVGTAGRGRHDVMGLQRSAPVTVQRLPSSTASQRQSARASAAVSFARCGPEARAALKRDALDGA